MSKPWEQEWKVSTGTGWAVVNGDREQMCHCWTGHGTAEEADARTALIASAPDMARAGLDVVQGVLAGVAPVLGPVSADEMIARGQSVTISAQQFAALVASLRKAGVPL